ncbi:hypothetical protein GLOIN_2v1512250 [Rhizophagus irregularis DAOM 181602=DAOM 197198]
MIVTVFLLFACVLQFSSKFYFVFYFSPPIMLCNDISFTNHSPDFMLSLSFFIIILPFSSSCIKFYLHFSLSLLTTKGTNLAYPFCERDL